jgi:hypothetical protein
MPLRAFMFQNRVKLEGKRGISALSIEASTVGISFLSIEAGLSISLSI